MIINVYVILESTLLEMIRKNFVSIIVVKIDLKNIVSGCWTGVGRNWKRERHIYMVLSIFADFIIPRNKSNAETKHQN